MGNDRPSTYERRRASAPLERQRILEAQAEATNAERGRRLAEIEEKFRAQFEVRPFRARLVMAPALLVPAAVRRGGATFDVSLLWLLAAAGFMDVRCPQCAGTSPWVAGRDRLGCRDCLSRPVTQPSPETAVVPDEPAPTRNDAPAKVEPPAGGEGGVSERSERRPPTIPKPARRPAPKPVPAPAPDPARRSALVQKEGGKLARRFWGCMLDGQRWPNKAMAQHSPARALFRLYGPDGPMVAVGMEPDDVVTGVSSATAEPCPGLSEATTGLLQAATRFHALVRECPYTLRWRLESGKPVLLEVLPFPAVVDAGLPPLSKLSRGVAVRLSHAAPEPRVELDEVASALWAVDLPRLGLPVIVRCLAAWWRAQDAGVSVDASAGAVAAAIVNLVGARSGHRQTAAGAHDADPSAVSEVARQLQELLGLSRQQPW